MLFLLDENNYACSCDEFRNKFSECIDKYEPSDSLKDFLSLLDIKIKKEELKDISTTYIVGQETLKNKNKIIEKPLQHEEGVYYHSPELSYKHLEKLKVIFKRLKKEIHK